MAFNGTIPSLRVDKYRRLQIHSNNISIILLNVIHLSIICLFQVYTFIAQQSARHAVYIHQKASGDVFTFYAPIAQ